MDFGDILNKWERLNTGSNGRQNSGGQSGDSPDTAAQERVHPLDAWLRINGIYDKDAEAEDTGHSAAEKRRRLRLKKPDAALDIHNLNRDETWEALDRFFNEAKSKGLTKLLIIHGKGNHSQGEAVLKRVTRNFIEQCPFAGESGQGKAAEGGGGATWVLLK